MTTTAHALELRSLTAIRARTKVLDDVSLSLQPGEIVAIIGPNGAGKTTLLEAAIGAVPLDAGLVSVGGRQLRGIADRARSFDYLSGEAEPPSEVRVATLLDEVTTSTRVDPTWVRSLELRLGLGPLRRSRAGTLSRGERRRLLLFAALASGKPFLLLDEPTGVFDPLQLLDVAALFRECAARGSGLLVTVHQMSDAEAFATRIVLLSRGRVIAAGTLAELAERAGVAPHASLQQVFMSLLNGGSAAERDPRVQA